MPRKIKEIGKKEFEEAMAAFCKYHGDSQRYASFDYCYQYFNSFIPAQQAKISEKDHMQASCLHLAFYLASWGMFRGSSYLLKKSSRYFQTIIAWIAGCDEGLWSIDVDAYTDENIDLLIKAFGEIEDVLGVENRPSVTLVTKIMLGVFGNTPAFDMNFRKAFGMHTFNKRNLKKIYEFYEANKDSVDREDVCCYDFNTGQQTGLKYPKAKIVDMYGFIVG